MAVLLGGCSHSFDADQALEIWQNHCDEDSKLDRFVVAALADAFCRAGHLHKGYDAICEYEQATNCAEFDEVMWTSMLSACRIYEDSLMAQHVFQQMQRRFGKNEEFLRQMRLLLLSIGTNRGRTS